MTRLSASLLLILAIAACSPGSYYHGRRLLEDGRDQEAADAFREEIRRDPLAAGAWRELGVALYGLGDYARADSALAQARRLAPDLRTVLYQGLVREASGDEDGAIRAYRRVLSLRPDASVRKLAHAHFEDLVRKQAERQAEKARAEEASGDYTAPAGNSIAVATFDTSDLPPDLSSIGIGLAEFTALDLGKIHALQVVERLRIERIMGELDLSSSGLVDPATRLQAGRLVGSRRLVTGSVQVPAAGDLELYGALADVAGPSSTNLDPISGRLDAFFRLEKQLVFAIVEDLGLTLTPEERAAIETVPTESFAAFLAYCRGLAFRDQGMYREAAGEFQRARQADGGFAEAGEMEQLSSDVATYDGSGAGAVVQQAGLAAGVELGQFLGVMQAETGMIPVAATSDAGGPPTVEPPRTGSVTGVRIIIGGDYR